MEIKNSVQNGVTLIQIAGKLDTNTAQEADKSINKTIDEGNHKLKIDFSELVYISSAGLRIMLSVSKKLKQLSGDLTLCGMNETVKEVFEISGFTMIFNIEDSCA